MWNFTACTNAIYWNSFRPTIVLFSCIGLTRSRFVTQPARDAGNSQKNPIHSWLLQKITASGFANIHRWLLQTAKHHTLLLFPTLWCIPRCFDYQLSLHNNTRQFMWNAHAHANASTLFFSSSQHDLLKNVQEVKHTLLLTNSIHQVRVESKLIQHFGNS